MYLIHTIMYIYTHVHYVLICAPVFKYSVVYVITMNMYTYIYQSRYSFISILDSANVDL